MLYHGVVRCSGRLIFVVDDGMHSDFSFIFFDYFLAGIDSLTDSFRDEKALKETRFFSGTLTIAPLDGLRAVRAFVVFELNLPNPAMLTSFFTLRACL